MLHNHKLQNNSWEPWHYNKVQEYKALMSEWWCLHTESFQQSYMPLKKWILHFRLSHGWHLHLAAI